MRSRTEVITTTTLPIDGVLPDLKAALSASGQAVLVAPPGAGKSTRVPLALLAEPWLAGGRILMLEPRRLAARTVARYMASTLGEAVGETVGYRVRLESRAGPRTRLEVITEGVLTRILQSDPALEGVGLVIFDEFHERSLQADLGLALSLQSRALLRPDLRLLVMSATLEAEPVAALLGEAPVIVSEGRLHPIETRYLGEVGLSAGRPREGGLERTVARAVLDALRTESGDLLVFLPGAGEIRRVEAELAGKAEADVIPLHGSLTHQEQDRALLPSPPGRRKVVLASAIAETSLTVEGIRVVIDSGLMRVPRFSPRTGMTRLETLPVSRSSADQRRGRAGRLGPGLCLRLWSEQADRGLLPRSRPEILEADLAPLALELAAWGVRDPGELRWLDPPPQAALDQARELLTQLGALERDGRITGHGRQMASAGLHPRLAHMVLKALELGLGSTACDLAALLSDRDILRGEGSDLRARLEALEALRAGGGPWRRGRTSGQGGQTGPGAAAGRDPGPAERALAEAEQWRRHFGVTGAAGDRGPDPDRTPSLLLALAYPDRIAQRRGPGRFLLRNGRGAVLPPDDPLAHAPWLVAADLDDQGADSRIYLAAPLSEDDLERHFAEQIAEERIVAWDREAQAVRARRRSRLGALTLKEEILPEPETAELAAALLEGIRLEGLEILPWSRAARQFQERVAFIGRLEPGWPDLSDPALLDSLPDWLGPHLYGLRSRAQLQTLPLTSVLEGMLSREQRRELDSHVPTHLSVPGGSRIPIDYSDPDAPVLAVRLQEMFGVRETPRIGRGRVPLTLHLLSPAHRPVQVTRDLSSFWQNAYFEVRKDLRGRYPKHHWPEDPLSATPTNRAKPRQP